MNQTKHSSKMPSLRLKQQLKLIMGKLKQPQNQKHTHSINLYNDFLILSVIVDKMPP